MGVKIVLKTHYIRNVRHRANALEYAGNKIEAQLAVLEGGSVVEAGAADRIAGDSGLESVRLTLKGGRTVELSPEKYRRKVEARPEERSEQIIHGEDGERTFKAAEYLRYIAYRPSVEKSPDKKHGLFTLEGDADMEAEKEKLLRNRDSIMWSQIISLSRADAERTGYDHRAAWQNLVTAKSAEIAKIYNIDPANLALNAAYHDKDHHPHLHLYFYSTDPREGLVKDMESASGRLKSLFFNEIFRDDVSYLKTQKTDRRGRLETRLEELLRGIRGKDYSPPPEACDKLLELSGMLREMKGKNVYGFQKPEIRERVDNILRLLVEKDPHLDALFGLYLETQRQFIEQYTEKPEKIEARLEEFRERFFHPRLAQRGKPGSGDRAVLHNEILRFAKTLTEQMPEEQQEEVKQSEEEFFFCRKTGTAPSGKHPALGGVHRADPRLRQAARSPARPARGAGAGAEGLLSKDGLYRAPEGTAGENSGGVGRGSSPLSLRETLPGGGKGVSESGKAYPDRSAPDGTQVRAGVCRAQKSGIPGKIHLHLPDAGPFNRPGAGRSRP